MYVKELIERLQKYYDPDAIICAPIWEREDVMSAAEEIDIEITEQQADNILFAMQEGHDATVGISWDVIKIYLYDVEQEETEPTYSLRWMIERDGNFERAKKSELAQAVLGLYKLDKYGLPEWIEDFESEEYLQAIQDAYGMSELPEIDELLEG